MAESIHRFCSRPKQADGAKLHACAIDYAELVEKLAIPRRADTVPSLLNFSYGESCHAAA